MQPVYETVEALILELTRYRSKQIIMTVAHLCKSHTKVSNHSNQGPNQHSTCDKISVPVLVIWFNSLQPSGPVKGIGAWICSPCWPMFMSSGQTELFSNGIKLLPELDDGMTDKCIAPRHNCLIHSNFSTGWWEVKLFMAAEIGWSIKLKFNHLCYRLVSAVPTCTLLHIILTTPALFAPSSPLLSSSSLPLPFFATR